MAPSDNDLTLQSSQHTDPDVVFYGKMLTFTQLQLKTADLSIIESRLEALLSNRASQIPIVIKSEVDQDLDTLIDLLWNWGLQPIGVVTGPLDDKAIKRQLAIFPADGKRIERIRPKKVTASQKAATSISSASTESDPLSEANLTAKVSADITPSFDTQPSHHDQITSMIYDQMLRSGQSINHVGGDLILTNSINNGAEAITDNSLHIYGRAQGRLVAGATGDKDARIFCQSFNPSLVSVAGTYCLRDNLPPELIDKPVQVSYKEGEGLVFTLMNNM
ncbi:MAG: septum site-determining protein MinC [Psychrobacter sp.]|nr:septum site-determining protein MinC [Psychrobacter sp.]